MKVSFTIMEIIMNKTETVEMLWALFSRADYRGSELILHENLQVQWPTSRESYDSREKFIAVNEVFGAGWSFEIQVIEESLAGRVISVVYVSSPDCMDSFSATSIFDFENGLITNIETHWAFKYKQPNWRKNLSVVY